MEEVLSMHDLQQRLQSTRRLFLLLYKGGSETSQCAFRHLEAVSIPESGQLTLCHADVMKTRELHPAYGIQSVPALLVFEEGQFVNAIKGCQDTRYYQALSENTLQQLDRGSSGKASKSVTVFSTPSCSWCTTLKSFLRKHGISFTDVDVSRDEEAAAEMVRRSGQQGVPQTLVDGQVVVGFDQGKLKKLLEIHE